jgi:IS1 family transposase
MDSMNRLSTERRAKVIAALVEGNSIRATCRMTGTAKGTVTRLLVDLGRACAEYQDRTLRNLRCDRVQADEIWSFCYAKQRNVPLDHKGEFGYGDVWTWTAICADSKLVFCWHMGRRDGRNAAIFMDDVASRLANRVQLTTDGYRKYVEAIGGAFGKEIDFAMLRKLYGRPLTEAGQERYSPSTVIAVHSEVITGDPDPEHISTSYVERQNLTMRMGMRRYTRLTNAFSKKIENLYAAVALHFMWYNFGRPHRTLSRPYPTTPAMAAGVTDHVWTPVEIAGLIEVNDSSSAQAATLGSR